MNSSVQNAPAPAPAPSSSRRGDDDESSRRANPEQQQAEGVFERLLRAKSAARERSDEQDDGDKPREGDAVPAGAAWLGSALPAAARDALPAAAGVVTEPSATLKAAALEALHATPTSPLQPGGDATQQWQVSLREPLGVAMEMQATRAPQPAHGVQAPWSLTLSASAQDAALLTRHASRLHERLRARSVEHDHVRIERDESDGR